LALVGKELAGRRTEGHLPGGKSETGCHSLSGKRGNENAFVVVKGGGRPIPRRHAKKGETRVLGVGVR